MARFYANRIKQGKMSLLDVPTRYREQVAEILASEFVRLDDDGFVVNSFDDDLEVK